MNTFDSMTEFLIVPRSLNRALISIFLEMEIE